MSDGELKAAAAVTHALDMIAALAPPGSRAFWLCYLISPYLYLQRMKCRCLRCPISDNKNIAQNCGAFMTMVFYEDLDFESP